MRDPLVNAFIAAAAVIAMGAGCNNSATAPGGALGTITMTSDADALPADGISLAHVKAVVTNAPPGAVLTFQLSGIGLLSETNVRLENGEASVELWAPLDDELASEPTFTSTVKASLLVKDKTLEGAVDVTFTLPTTGAPVLDAHAAPDRVFAGGADVITLVIDGLRLSSPTVTLSADSDLVSIPSSVTLEDVGSGLFHKELRLPTPAEPVDVVVTINSEGALAATAVVRYIAADAPAFDLTGKFAQVSYSGMRIGGIVFLDPDPQCIVSPTFALANVVQTGSHLELSFEICDLNMPQINAAFFGPMGTHVSPGYVRAMNDGAEPVELDLPDVGPGATFSAPPGEPYVMGADLADPHEALPTDPNDPRVTDDDGDGNPGVTISGDNAIVGDQFIVSRSTLTSMTGTIESSDVVTGESSAETESTILNGGAGGMTPTITPLGEPWTLVRVDGVNGTIAIAARDGDPSSVSCADVLAYEDELQALYPAPDVSGACP